jgi:hypothetical protein
MGEIAQAVNGINLDEFKLAQLYLMTSSIKGALTQIPLLEQIQAQFNALAAVEQKLEQSDWGFAGSGTIADGIVNMVSNISAVENIISRAKAINADAMVLFKGGKLEVTHNLTSANIELKVDIDSRKLAREIVNVKWSAGTRRVGVNEKNRYLPAGGLLAHNTVNPGGNA